MIGVQCKCAQLLDGKLENETSGSMLKDMPIELLVPESLKCLGRAIGAGVVNVGVLRGRERFFGGVDAPRMTHRKYSN